MPSSDIEAFDYLISGAETEEVDYLAYGIFAYRKKKWIEHFSEQNSGSQPSQQQIDEWISQLTEYDFERMRDDAANSFDAASKEYLKDYIEEEKKKAVDASILKAVENFSNPWRDLGIALLMAILAPLLLGFIVLIISFFDKSFPVHVSFGAEQQSSAPNGK